MVCSQIVTAVGLGMHNLRTAFPAHSARKLRQPAEAAAAKASAYWRATAQRGGDAAAVGDAGRRRANRRQTAEGIHRQSKTVHRWTWVLAASHENTMQDGSGPSDLRLHGKVNVIMCRLRSFTSKRTQHPASLTVRAVEADLEVAGERAGGRRRVHSVQQAPAPGRQKEIIKVIVLKEVCWPGGASAHGECGKRPTHK